MRRASLPRLRTERASRRHLRTTRTALLSVTDPFGRVLSFAYDNYGRISTVTDPAGELYTFAYDHANFRLTSVTYPDTRTKTYHYEHPDQSKYGHLLTGITDENGARFSTWSYDSEGRVLSSEHAGAVEQTGFS